MKLFVTAAIIAFFIELAAPALRSQTAADVSSADSTRQRMEAAIERQKQSVASMSNAAARTKSSAESGQKASSENFFSLPAPEPGALAPSAPCEPLPPAEIDSLVHSASASTSVDPRLITAVMQEESGYRPCAVSPKGALGLMQILPETAGEFGVTDPFGPQENVLAGAKRLRQLIDHYGGDLSLVLSAYNAGPGAVDSTMTVPHFAETVNYVRDILSRLSPQNSGTDPIPPPTPLPSGDSPEEKSDSDTLDSVAVNSDAPGE